LEDNPQTRVLISLNWAFACFRELFYAKNYKNPTSMERGNYKKLYFFASNFFHEIFPVKILKSMEIHDILYTKKSKTRLTEK